MESLWHHRNDDLNPSPSIEDLEDVFAERPYLYHTLVEPQQSASTDVDTLAAMQPHASVMVC